MPVVHRFRVYDVQTDEWIYPDKRSTLMRIERIRGEVIPDTGLEVSDDEMDSDGKHVGRPPRTGFQTSVSD